MKKHIIIGVSIIAVIAVAVSLAFLSHQTSDEKGSVGASPSAGAHVEQVRPKTFQANALPFTITGVDSKADTVEVSEGSEPAELSDSWTLGGDFRQIASFPIDADTVFGSTTDTPDNLQSYSAAMLRRDGSAQSLGGNDSAEYYEPQDGSGDGSRIVWRASTINTVDQTGYDNWQIQIWDKSSSSSKVLGSAEEINGTNATPQTYGEIVPTANDDYAYFASNIRINGTWQESVLSWSLKSTGTQGKATIIDSGNFPAATQKGVIYASSAEQKTNKFKAYSKLMRNDGQASSTVFSLSSKNAKWGISGIWAHGNYRAVSFSDGTIDSGNYIGLWSDDFAHCLAWVPVKSSSVIASMNDSWIVWGSGSQTDNAGMYAFNWSKKEVKYLGELEGYSRPTIASENDIVMIPKHSDSDQAVSFTVGQLR